MGSLNKMTPVQVQLGVVTLTLRRAIGQVETFVAAGAAVTNPEAAVEQGIRAYARARDALRAAVVEAEANGAATHGRMRLELWCKTTAGTVLASSIVELAMAGEVSAAVAAVASSLLAGTNAGEFPASLYIQFAN